MDTTLFNPGVSGHGSFILLENGLVIGMTLTKDTHESQYAANKLGN